VNGEPNDFCRTIEAVQLLEDFGGLWAVFALVAREVLDEHGTLRLEHRVAVYGDASAPIRVAKRLVYVVARSS
jgi:hypothetical protein